MNGVGAVGLPVLMNRQAMVMFRMGVVAGRVEVQRNDGPRESNKNKRQSNAQTATHDGSVVTDTWGVNVPVLFSPLEGLLLTPLTEAHRLTSRPPGHPSDGQNQHGTHRSPDGLRRCDRHQRTVPAGSNRA